MDDLINRKAAIDQLHQSYNLLDAERRLEELPSAQPVARDMNVLSNDLISRQAAIDALGERPIVWSNDDEYALGERNQYDIDRLAIETVPSAQPEQPSFSCGHEDDLISRKAAIDAFLTELTKRERKNLLHTWSTVEVKYFVADMLEKMPSAQTVARDINVLSNDLIIRQEAIDALRMDISIIPFAKAREYVRAAIETIYNRLEELPFAQPERKWVPCDVRMPEEHDSIFAKFKGTDRWQKIMWEKQSEKVLVTVEYEDGTRAVEVANTFDGKWKYKTAVVDRYPIAWCHFPEPYREEGGDK